MKEMTYIVYCTSGLGNRLRPLASAIAYCNITGRKLRVYWDIKTPNGCLSPLSSLFENKFDLISLEEISDLAPDKIKLFTEKGPGHGVQREADRFGRNQLLELSKGSPPFDSQALDLEEKSEIVIVYDNDYLMSVSKEQSLSALRSLIPVSRVRDKVYAMARKCGVLSETGKLVKSIKGVHARGTDFPIQQALEQYVGAVHQCIGTEVFFLSTDDLELERGIRAAFPDQVISRDDRMHLQLNEGKSSWYDPDSFTVTEDHAIDALVDIYTLSFTNLVVFHPGSTFADISHHLYGVLIKPEPAFERERAIFIERAKQLLPRGEGAHPIEIECGEYGPRAPEETSIGFMYWETLGFQIPFMERLFMNSFNGQPILNWDGEIFDQLAAIPFERFPKELFDHICPYKEAWSQMEVLRDYARGRKVLIIGSETFWLELLCILAGATEVTTVEYRPIHWSPSSKCKAMTTLTWETFLNDLDAYHERYDLILSYSSLEHSGLGRYGDRLMPLGDLFTFQLMSRCIKPSGLCAVAVPTGQDLTHFNAHRIYGEKRIRAMEHVSGLRYIGLAGPDKGYLQSDLVEDLRDGWNLDNLASLPLGQYRQPILCFGKEGFSVDRYALG